MTTEKQKRVFELAKELEVSSREILQLLTNMGHEGRNHMSTLEEDLITSVSDRITGKAKGSTSVGSDSKQTTVSAPVTPKPEVNRPARPTPVTRQGSSVLSGSGRSILRDGVIRDDGPRKPTETRRAAGQTPQDRRSAPAQQATVGGTRTHANRPTGQRQHVFSPDDETAGRPGGAIRVESKPEQLPVETIEIPISVPVVEEAPLVTAAISAVTQEMKPTSMVIEPAAEVQQTAETAVAVSTVLEPSIEIASQAPVTSSTATVPTGTVNANQNAGRPVDQRPRPQGDRPPFQGNQRPQGDRPPFQGNQRPQGDRPPFQGDQRPQGDRPPFQGNQRPQADRPPSQGGPRPQGDRPPFQGGPRPQSDRPPFQGSPRPQGDRAPFQGGPRPQGDRPPFQGGPRPQGDRPPFQGGPRPQSDRPPFQGGPRPQGDRPPFQGGPRPQGARPPFQGGGGAAGQRPGGPPRSGGAGGGRLAVPPPPPQLEQQKQLRHGQQKRGEVNAANKGRKPFDRRSDVNDDENGMRRGARLRGRGKPIKAIGTVAPKTPPVIKVMPPITVKELAAMLNREAGEVIKKLLLMGVIATINQDLDLDTSTLIAHEFGAEVEEVKALEVRVLDEEAPDEPENLVLRAPVVTVMGHVDHGKTSLLDAIRSTNVIASEAGGITQHIGAYHVTVNGKGVVFLDTPGHEAFTAMRARGAQVTDIAVLVVAADDGVMPQTIEAINHAKAANVPIVVAVNKIDKPGAEPDKVKQQLTEYGLVAEEWGGETIFVPLSAKKRIGIESLLEMLLLVAEVQDLKANPNRAAKGTVIEAELDKGRGPVATVLIQNGTLRVGDAILAGVASGRVRALISDRGERLKEAGPSTPVTVLGLNEVPMASSLMHVVTDEKLARMITAERTATRRKEEIAARSRVTLEELFQKIKEGEIRDLNIVIKGDVQGSVEALKAALERLSNEEVRVRVIHSAVGGITESDITFAAASNAIIIGFNVRPDANRRRMAEEQKVDMRLYRVIYEATEDVEKAMKGLLAPVFRESVMGRAEIREVFKVTKVGTIAGCYVVEGKVTRNAKVRVIRDGVVIHEGAVDSLKRFKEDVKEVATGYECGIGLERFNNVLVGDSIEFFVIEEVARA